MSSHAEGGRGRGGGQRGGRGGYHDSAGRGKGPNQSSYEVQLYSNQYRLTLGETKVVYQYVLDIKPDEFWEAAKVHAIIRTKRIALEKALG